MNMSHWPKKSVYTHSETNRITKSPYGTNQIFLRKAILLRQIHLDRRIVQDQHLSKRISLPLEKLVPQTARLAIPNPSSKFLCSAHDSPQGLVWVSSRLESNLNISMPPFLCMCLCVRVWLVECVCVCVRKWKYILSYLHKAYLYYLVILFI